MYSSDLQDFTDQEKNILKETNIRFQVKTLKKSNTVISQKKLKWI